MAIEKYGTAICGYGSWVSYRGGYSAAEFSPNIYIIAKSSTIKDTSSRIKGFPGIIKHSIYVVFDGTEQTWKEYFTGMPVNNCVLDEKYISHYDDGWGYDVDKMDMKIPKAQFVADIKEYTSTKFAEEIARFSDAEIKEMVTKIYELNVQAKKWGDVFEQTAQQVIKERDRKEAGVPELLSKMESGFGKYANMQSSLPTEKNMLDWIKQGRCSHCGGEFKGLFSKVCRKCGAPKDY